MPDPDEYPTHQECVQAFLVRRWPLKVAPPADMALDLLLQLRVNGWVVTPEATKEQVKLAPHDCSTCGTTDDDCNKGVRERGRACCARCHRTDTHRTLGATSG